MTLFTHLLEEHRLRGCNLPAGVLSGAALPKPTFPAAPRATDLVSRVGNLKAPYVVKLGKAVYLEETFSTGRWGISPASSYSDSSLNHAQRDSELELTTYALKSEVKLRAYDRKTGKFTSDLEPLGDVTVTSRSSTDYYVSCLSSRLELRLFDDFDADSCIVIQDPLAFGSRVLQAAKKRFAGWRGRFHDVSYVDPYNYPPDDIDLYFAKHFRYWYQREVRVVWLPDTPQNNLDHVFIELGDIKNICTFERL